MRYFSCQNVWSLSLFTRKRTRYVPHDYKKSPPDHSLNFRFWAPACTFPQVLGSQKISSLPFHKFVLSVLLIAQRRNNDAHMLGALQPDEWLRASCVQFQVSLQL
ncbi:hypothetical protein BDE02_19G037400 [Populus trichocarpa]|nr:hypothetical protein BDE02_19G037400 [Populus trichocarpa]